MPVAQIVAGFTKVFVGEIVEKGERRSSLHSSRGDITAPESNHRTHRFAARAVQERRGEKGPLSPDHLREAYRMYQEETGRVGSARPLRGKRLFTR